MLRDYATEAGRRAMAEAAAARMDARLVAAVSARLGVAVTLARYDTEARTSAQIPVFNVPASHADAARSLGLRVAT